MGSIFGSETCKTCLLVESSFSTLFLMERFVVDVSSDDEDCVPGRADRFYDRAVGRRMEESDDVLVVDEFSLPAVKRRRTNPEPSSLRKCENDDDDECLVLRVDPDKPVVVADVKVSGGCEEDDLLVVAEKGQVACRDYPHSRDQCATYPFTSSSHEEYCHLCHCYVCDSPAPCSYWGNGNLGTDHCHSTDKEEGWKSLRKLFKQKNVVTSRPLKLMNDSSVDFLTYRDAVPLCHSNLVSLRSSSLQPCSTILNSDPTNFIDQDQTYIVSSHRQRLSQQTTGSSSLNPRLQHLQSEVHLPSLPSQLMHPHTRSRRSGSLQAGSTIMANHFANNVSRHNHIPKAVQQKPTCAIGSSQTPNCHQGQLRFEDILVLSPVIPDQMQTTPSSLCTVAQFESSKLSSITAKDIMEKSWEDLLASLASELEDPIRRDSHINGNNQSLLVLSPPLPSEKLLFGTDAATFTSAAPSFINLNPMGYDPSLSNDKRGQTLEHDQVKDPDLMTTQTPNVVSGEPSLDSFLASIENEMWT